MLAVDEIEELGQEETIQASVDKAKYSELVHSIYALNQGVYDPSTLEENMGTLKASIKDPTHESDSLRIIKALYKGAFDRLGGEQARQVVESTTDVVISSLPVFEKIIESPKEDNETASLSEIFRYALKYGSDQQKKAVRECLFSKLGNWTAGLPHWSFLAADLLDTTPQLQKEQAMLWLEELLSKTDTAKPAKELLSFLAGNPNWSDSLTSEVENRFLIPLFSQYGLDYQSLLKSWEAGGLNANSHIRAIFELESSFPESNGTVARTLNTEFGIKDFGRYSIDLLKDLYAQRNENKPYVLVLFGVYDVDGVFGHGNEPMTTNLYRKLKELGYALRLYEWENKLELAKGYIKASRRYGKTQQRPFSIIAGHGTIDSIRGGETKHQYNASDTITQNAFELLHQSDFEGMGVKRMGIKYLDESEEVFAFSCHTGEPHGILQKMSETFPGHKITGPTDKILPYAHFGLNADEKGKLEATVRFSANEATYYVSPNTKTKEADETSVGSNRLFTKIKSILRR